MAHHVWTIYFPFYMSGDNLIRSLYDSHSQTKLGKGKVFTDVCQSFCPGVGGYLWSFVLPGDTSGTKSLLGGGYVEGVGMSGVGRYHPLRHGTSGRLEPAPQTWDKTRYSWQAGGTHPNRMVLYVNVVAVSQHSNLAWFRLL